MPEETLTCFMLAHSLCQGPPLPNLHLEGHPQKACESSHDSWLTQFPFLVRNVLFLHKPAMTYDFDFL